MISLVLLQSAIILAVALFILVRGADFFIAGASAIGRSLGMSSFAVGVLIVGMGTSLPELAASLAAGLSGETEISVANAVGSNITNILLIVGVLAFFGGPILIKQKLIKTELPLFFIATVHFVAVIYDGVVDRIEAVLLLATFGAYMWYVLVESKNGTLEVDDAPKEKITAYLLITTVAGLLAILLGAKYAVDMTVILATELLVPVGVVAIAAIAVGTSLPELVVSIKAIRSKKTEMAIGNIFGSNAFNMLVVVGLPGIFTTLIADEVVMELGLGIMLAASLILFISGLARQLMRWEGLMMLIFFAFFVSKLFSFV